eukprot:3105465-Amphidinium_carterae.1
MIWVILRLRPTSRGGMEGIAAGGAGCDEAGWPTLFHEGGVKPSCVAAHEIAARRVPFSKGRSARGVPPSGCKRD